MTADLSQPPVPKGGSRASRIRLGALGGASLLAALGCWFVFGWGSANRADQPSATQGGSPRIKAPELDGGIAWFNCEQPIRLTDLRGRVVLIDFWTLCCINCIHTLPDLDRLERKYPNQLVIIGVHSGKFDHEKNSASIRRAIARYEIRHPVVNDAEQRIWQAYCVESWPTLVLIDPEGYLVARGSGEGLYEAVDQAIRRLVELHRKKGTLNERPPSIVASSPTSPSSLQFPGKVLADLKSKRLFIADSTHHRIVITNLGGKRIAIAGDGTAGRRDGGFEIARFNDPQGMALVGETLYVADRKNHLLRAVDLAAHTVKTVAGTGEQGRPRRGGPALSTPLSSPWDIVGLGQVLYVAMAGSHQIWAFDLQRDELRPIAGNGSEELRDGDLKEASFAQPSGITTDGERLYVVDSESSAVREITLQGPPRVRTLVGQGLFIFGDRDGTGEAVRLQHPLGIVYHDRQLYVADTYNSKIKAIDPATRNVRTVWGGGSDSQTQEALHEPGGLSVAGDRFYIADTNANRIQVLDLPSQRVWTLPLSDVPAPQTAKK